MDPAAGVCQIALVERHRGTGGVVNGFVSGFGYDVPCAVASTVAHDSHHMIVVGTSKADMALAANRLGEVGGGVTVWREGRELALVRLPIAGLMSDAPAEEVAEAAEAMVAAMAACGCRLNNAYMQHSLLALVVIPSPAHLRPRAHRRRPLRAHAAPPARVRAVHDRSHLAELPLISPPQPPDELFSDAEAAVAALQVRYAEATAFLRGHFAAVMMGEAPEGRYRAFYPQVSLTTASFAKVNSRLSFGHVTEPGVYETTITRPDLFEGYLLQQIDLLIQNHGMPIRIGTSDTPIPLHFAMGEDAHVEGSIEAALHRPLRDLFDVPDLNTTDDHIVNGTVRVGPSGARPLAPFTAQRIDYSLARLAHYTATSSTHFQNHVLFTNYQFYMDEFVEFAARALEDPASGYEAFVGPGNIIATRDGQTGEAAARLPQMPAFHLIRPRAPGSRWSTSASGHRTPRPSPTTSPCSARTSG